MLMTFSLFKKQHSSIDDGERNSETRRPSKDSEKVEKSCEKSREVSSKYLNAAFFYSSLGYLSKKHCLLLFISSRKRQQQRRERRVRDRYG